MTKIVVNGVKRDMTPEEQAEYDALVAAQAAEKADPTTYQLTKRQIRTALVQAGKSASYVADMIAAMPDSPQKEQAIIDWDDAPYYTWDHPLTQALRTTVVLLGDFTEQEMINMWIAADELPK